MSRWIIGDSPPYAQRREGRTAQRIRGG